MNTILLVEDNPHILRINAEVLGLRGYEVLRASTAAEARGHLQWHPVDLIVLDIMLPDANGLDLCRELKKQYHVPILFLTALGENQDVVEGLRAGGDDYLSKPYDLEVFVARVEARLRERNDNRRHVSYGCLRLDTVSLTGFVNGQDIQLTQKEYALLEYLMCNKGLVLSREKIEQHIWNYDYEGGSNVIDVYIRCLRKKIDDGYPNKLIHTVRGAGYVLRADE